MQKAQTCARAEVPGATQGIPAWANRPGGRLRARARRRRLGAVVSAYLFANAANSHADQRARRVGHLMMNAEGQSFDK